MRTIILISVLFVLCNATSARQKQNYLEKGNHYLNEKRYTDAESVFREAIRYDGTKAVYHAQLAQALIGQKRYREADKIIESLILKDSISSTALWYGAMSNYLNPKGDLRKAVAYFDRATHYLNPTTAQYAVAFWFMGDCYLRRLKATGLDYEEVSWMLDTFEKYLKLAPTASNAGGVSALIAKIKAARPGRNVRNWIYTTEENEPRNRSKQHKH
ncbi:MAG TPA: tetratricopeptide repeat protein [Bacteroidota bacterium]|jgi:tetratricopeptide (TPR) repeat protein|nr:tetratricopeptide repeat protein [Bacteroidota bacterium]